MNSNNFNKDIEAINQKYRENEKAEMEQSIDISLKQEQKRKENQIISNEDFARQLQQRYQQGYEEEKYQDQGTSTIIEYLNKNNGKLKMEGQSKFTDNESNSSICTFASAFMALDIIQNSQIPLNNKEDITNYERMIYRTAQSIFKRRNINDYTSANEFFNAKDIYHIDQIYDMGNNVIINKIVGSKYGTGESQAWVFKDNEFYKIDTHCGGGTGIQKSNSEKLLEKGSWSSLSLTTSEIKEIRKYYKGYFHERGGGKKLKKLKKILKKTKKTKKVRKHKGITQIGGNKGKLRKGYKYTGKRLKNGMAEIKKVKSKK